MKKIIIAAYILLCICLTGCGGTNQKDYGENYNQEQEAYVLHEKLDMDYAPRKIALPEEMEKKEYFLIVKHHIDTNHHVNNGQYVQMAMELLPDDFRISQMRAEYKKAALLGDMVVPYIHIEEKKCTVLLCDEAQKPYAVVEFQ